MRRAKKSGVRQPYPEASPREHFLRLAIVTPLQDFSSARRPCPIWFSLETAQRLLIGVRRKVICEPLRVRDVEVEPTPPGGPPSSPQSGR